MTENACSNGVLTPFIAEMSEAVRHEIAAAKKDPHRHIALHDGEPLWSKSEGTLVRFRCESSVTIAPESPVALEIDDEKVDGTLVGVEDFDVLIFVKSDVTETIPHARLSNEPWFIQESLIRNFADILQMPDGDASVPLALLGESKVVAREDPRRAEDVVQTLRALNDARLHPNGSQRAALSRLLGSALHYVWGPPGTGKTSALAQAARAVVLRGERVLVLAHANVAVDVAALRIADMFAGTSELSEGRILRVGVPQLRDVEARGTITPDAVLERQQPELIAERDALEAERRTLVAKLKRTGGDEAAAARLEVVRSALANVRKRIDEEMTHLIGEARVLVSTLSRAAIDPRVLRWPAETLFIDEASMAPFPFVAASAIYPTRKRCVVFGDFRQLPPVYVGRSKPVAKWLGRDAFEIGGITERIDAGLDDRRVTMLETQYRMAGPIADVVSGMSYMGRLRTGEGAGRWKGSTPLADPWPDTPIVLVDSSLLGGPCITEPRLGSYSRANPIEAMLAIEAAARLRAGGIEDVALTAPYRAQARILDVLLGGARDDTGPRAGTIHKLQGSERDAVIVNLTDAPPAKGPSQLTDNDPDLARRLLNVAMSRAKCKLVVIANAAFLVQRSRAGGPLRQVLDLLSARGRLWRPAPDELRAGSASGVVQWLGDWQVAAPLIARYVADAIDGLVVNWPASIPASAALSAALRDACERLEQPARMHVPPLIAQELEDTSAELRLLTKTCGFFITLGPDRLVVGGSEPEHAFALVRGENEVQSLRGLLDPDGERVVSLSAAVLHAIDRVCGRCPACGEFRRPRKAPNGRCVLRCASTGHPAAELNAATMDELVSIAEVRCTGCDRLLKLQTRKEGGHVLACTGRSRECRRNVIRDCATVLGG